MSGGRWSGSATKQYTEGDHGRPQETLLFRFRRQRSYSDERRAVPPGPFGEPAAVLFEWCVGQHEELAHDSDHRSLPGLSLRDELAVLRARVR